MMDSNKKNTKFLPWILAVLLIGIWGEIGYQIFVHNKPEIGTSAGAQASFISQSRKPATRYVFRNNVRDPFAYLNPVRRMKRKPKVVPLIVHIWVPPPLSLEGIIVGDGKKTAILGTQTGGTYFLSEGDTLLGVEVLKVSDKEVTYRYQNKDTSWTVSR